MPSGCACGCGVAVCAPKTYFKACRDRLSKQGIPCPANVKAPHYLAFRLAVQEHGPGQTAQKANAAAGLAPTTFKPLPPHMQQRLDKNVTGNAISNPIRNNKRKLENFEKNKQTVQDNPNLSATDKMSDGKHASTCTCHTIPSIQIAVHFA